MVRPDGIPEDLLSELRAELQTEYERCVKLARDEVNPELRERFSGLAVGTFFAIERIDARLPGPRKGAQ
jgi:hypothetical protein